MVPAFNAGHRKAAKRVLPSLRFLLVDLI